MRRAVADLARQPAGGPVCAAGTAAVVVLGHPNYYPRFGFSAKTAEALRTPV